MKLVFIDAEFTGEHAYTTLVSLGLITLEGRELYLTLNDYDLDQVTDWLRDNVLSMIDPKTTVSSAEAHAALHAWLSKYADGERIHLVSSGKGADIELTYQLYHQAYPDLTYFHVLHCLPDYLNHAEHFDLNTLLFAAGFDLDQPREEFLGRNVSASRHSADYDARIVRDCFLKLLETPELTSFAQRIREDR